MKTDTNIKDKKEKKYYSLYFLIFVLFLYVILFVFNPERTQSSLEASGRLFIRIVPIMVVVFLFMGIMNYLVKPRGMLKYIGKGSGIRGWFLAISLGILSHGPIYVWYPLLKDLRAQGMKDSLIAAFLYNRAIKIPLLPLMIYYFELTFVFVVLVYMIIASIVEGKIIDAIEERFRKIGSKKRVFY